MNIPRTVTIAALTAVAAVDLPASASAAPAATTTKRVTAYDFPRAGSRICVFTEGSCLVGEYRTTFLGTEFYCLVPRP